MPARHRSRQRALQVLFQLDLHHQSVDDAIRSYYGSLYSEEAEEGAAPPDPFMEQLVHGTVDSMHEIDARITKHSAHWRVERMPAVDRNVLRLAVYEMTAAVSPPAVVINEALELARRFSGDESIPFINGILDAINREMSALGGGL